MTLQTATKDENSHPQIVTFYSFSLYWISTEFLSSLTMLVLCSVSYVHRRCEELLKYSVRDPARDNPTLGLSLAVHNRIIVIRPSRISSQL